MYFTFFFLLIVTAIVLLAKIYDKEIKQYVVSYLNQYLHAEVHVDNIHLDLLKRFPKATLVIEDAHIEDMNSAVAGDTMLYAQELLLKFDFWEIFEGQYNITHVEALNAKLNLSVNSEGQENYLIWKKKENQEKKDFQFNLQEVICSNTIIKYQNDLTDQYYRGTASSINLSGAFTRSTFDLDIKSDLTVNAITINELTYIKNEETTLNTVLHIDKPNRKYTINSGHTEISGLGFDITGSYQADSAFCDLAISGKSLQLNKVFTVFPSVFFEKFQAYKSDGVLDFNTTVIGETSKSKLPEINADFAIDNGSLTEAETGMQLRDLKFSGSYTNSGFGELDIVNLSGTLLNSHFNGSINLQNFDTPDLVLNLNGKLDLESVQSFFRFQTLEYLNGAVEFKANIQGRSVDGKFRTRKSKGSFEAIDVNLKTNINALEYTGLNGAFKLKNGDAYISHCSGNIFKSDFNIVGILKNFIPHVISRNQILTIEADLDSKYIDLSQITRMAASANEKRGAAPESIFPENIAFNLNTTVSKLLYGKFDAENIRGVATLKEQILNGRNVRFNANEGTYRANFEFDGSNPNNYLFTSDAKVRKIDITNFFTEFDNFGQTFIQDRHIKGKASAEVNLACALDNGFVIKQPTILSTLSLDVSDGELTNLEVLQEIAQYIEGNKLIKPFVNTQLMAEKLRFIQFSDMSNTIEIRNQKITIPRMEIESNVMDIKIRGEHWFDDRINYGFNFRLRDVLMKEDRDSEFGPIVDDGNGYRIFLSMTGTVDEPTFGIDKEEKKLARKEKVELEKQTMKSVLKQELGLFKKDSTIDTYHGREKPKVEFDLDWNEEDTTVNSVEEEFTSKKREERRKAVKGWIRKLESRFEGGVKKDSISVEIDDGL